MEKIEVELPFIRETPGTVVYGVARGEMKKLAVGQAYVRKDVLEKKEDGSWPQSIKLTVEPLG